jgi:CpeT protein
MMDRLCFLLVATFLTLTFTTTVRANEDLDSLAKWMEGSFSSYEHSRRDTAYQHVKLHLTRIWHDRKDGVWFYVEQTPADAPQAPSLQRIYQLSALEEGMFERAVYTLPQPDTLVGAWKDTSRLRGVSVKDLKKRFGCEVYMQFTGDKFFGSTHGMACSASIDGIAYVRTDVEVRWYGMMSWERGFNATGEQVWGQEKGGYVFLRERPQE